MIREWVRRSALSAVCLLLLAGCWSRRELNELMIVLGIGVDWKDGRYLVSYQVVNPAEISAQKGNTNRPPVTLYQGRGKTPFEAARAVTAEAPRKVYAGHLQLIVFGEQAARRGIADLIDNILRDNEFRLDFDLVVAKGMDAADLLRLYTPLEKLPTYSMLHSLQTSEKNWAPTVSVNVDEALQKLSGKGEELVLTGIELLGSPEKGAFPRNVQTFQPDSRFRYTGVAAFKEDRLVGWLDEKQSRGYSDISDNLDSSSTEIECGENQFVGIEITSSKARVKTRMQGGQAQADVKIKADAGVVNNPCRNVDLTDPAVIRDLEKKTERLMLSNAESAVAKAKQLKSDIFGFGGRLGKEAPAVWKRVKDDWSEEYFPHIDVRYHIRVTIRKTGTIGNSAFHQKG